MKSVFVNTLMIKRREFFLVDGDVFCYCCGAPMPCVADECKTDRFGRSFCSEMCRKKYYGGKEE